MQDFEIISLIQGEIWHRLQQRLITREHSPKALAGKATVLIGMRRVGKTFSLYCYLQKLVERNVPRESILFLNLEDDRLKVTTATELGQVIEQFYRTTPENHNRKTYIFLDEIQNILDWEKLARRLVENPKCELWITGSSAKMLSKEVATSFRGRSIAYEIWPYSFSEYLTARNTELPLAKTGFAERDHALKLLEQFLYTGGFPEVVDKSPELHRRILDDYRTVVLMRDIIERHKVTNIAALNALVSTIYSNGAKQLSVHKLFNDFRSRGITVGKDTLFEYLLHLEDAYLAFMTPVFRESTRGRSTSPKKSFCIDTGMMANFSVRPKNQLGKLFENLIFLDLRRRGYRIHYYVTKTGAEVDFVALKSSGQPIVVQACYDMSNPKTIKRESNGLADAMAELNCEGIIITPEDYVRNLEWIPSSWS